MTNKPQAHRPGVLLINFGGPTGPEELEPFLRELFDDVLPLPRWIRGFVGARIAASRSRKVLDAYTQIGWSPLVADSLAETDRVRQGLGGAVPVAAGMLYTAPTVHTALTDLLGHDIDALIAIGLFPHYSMYTTGSAFARVDQTLSALDVDLPVHFVPAYYDHPDYLEALVDTVAEAVEGLDGQGPIHLLFSPHGIPVAGLRRGDPYPEHIRETCRRVVAMLQWQQPWSVGWQSRVGPTRWLGPSTLDAIADIGRAGTTRLVVVPISFVGEHIETLDELDKEAAEHAHASGIEHYGRAAAVGGRPAFTRCLIDVAQRAIADLTGYRCFRCLVPKPAAHRKQKHCGDCKAAIPGYLGRHPDSP